MTEHRIVLKPGDSIRIELVEPLDNGYPDDVGSVALHWQDRDAPVGQIATKGRELQIDWEARRGRVGPVVVASR